MRLNNTGKSALFSFINTVAIFGSGILILGFFLDRYKFGILGWKSWILLLLAALVLVIMYVRGKQIFVYDSDGEALNFKNRNVYSVFSRPASDEFPKYKLKSFEIIDVVIFRKLYITIDSKKNNSATLKYDISYLSSKEVSDLKQSLNKVIKTNQENSR